MRRPPTSSLKIQSPGDLHGGGAGAEATGSGPIAPAMVAAPMRAPSPDATVPGIAAGGMAAMLAGQASAQVAFAPPGPSGPQAPAHGAGASFAPPMHGAGPASSATLATGGNELVGGTGTPATQTATGTVVPGTFTVAQMAEHLAGHASEPHPMAPMPATSTGPMSTGAQPMAQSGGSSPSVPGAGPNGAPVAPRGMQAAGELRPADASPVSRTTAYYGPAPGMTVPAPGSGRPAVPMFPEHVVPASTGPIARGTVGTRDLPPSAFDAPSGPALADMPAVEAPIVSDDARTVPQGGAQAGGAHVAVAGAARAGDDDKTIPAPGRGLPSGRPTLPVTPAPVEPAEKTRPDRPGGFSGGPAGQAPSPGVNVPRRGPGTLPPIQPQAVPDGPASSPSVVVGTSRARLVIVARDGTEGESFPFSSDIMTVGRSHGDLLFPEDPFLSPVHVRLQRTGPSVVLADAGTTNGVYLRIRGSAAVYPGDMFMIGHQLLRLENLDGQIQESPPSHDGTRMFGTPLPPSWGRITQVGRGGMAGDHFYLRGARVVLGREDGDLMFPGDPFVSREHARLRLEITGQAMSVFLEDLQSANGTYVRIRGSAEMRSGDTFRVGDQILRLRLD